MSCFTGHLCVHACIHAYALAHTEVFRVLACTRRGFREILLGMWMVSSERRYCFHRPTAEQRGVGVGREWWMKSCSSLGGPETSLEEGGFSRRYLWSQHPLSLSEPPSALLKPSILV